MNAYGARNSVTEDRVSAPAPNASATDDAPSQADARAQQSGLEQSLRQIPSFDEPAEVVSKPRPWTFGGAPIGRLVKIALGLALVVVIGWGPVRTMFATTSVEALVNARVETIRSPIEGIVASLPDSDRDWNASEPTPKLRVVDPLAERARLNDLQRQHQALESETRMLERQSELTKGALEALEAQVETFRRERLKLLDARLATQTAQSEAASAKASQAAAAKRRTEQLFRTGVSTTAESDRTRYEWAAANSTQAAEERHRDETRIERDAILQGVFVGDSYNDSPSSEQRAAELRLKAGELDARAAAVRSQMKLVADQIVEEDARFRERSEARVDLPASGRVWEMLTAPGERVGKGQDLMRVLDCSHPLVSANVDESVYNRLEVGGQATFRSSRFSDKTYDGVIVNLTGAAAASGNLAIPPGTMRKTSFHVTVAVEDVSGGGCAVGRTGIVTFSTSGEPVRAAADGGRGEGLAMLRSFLFF